MAAVKVRLDKAMGTSLIMLYGLACDARANPTVLGDTIAEQAFEKVDYDFARLGRKLKPHLIGPSIASRAKHFDDWTTEFLAKHEQATVVNLGAGLDSRVWRVDPGPGVTWYDVDYPGVIDVRRKIFPDRANYHLIGSSVTAPDWLDRIRPDLPTLVVAQGLTMYLQPEDGHALFRRITDHFAGGVIALDTHNSYAIRRQTKLVNRYFGATLHWAINSPADLERRNPRLHCTDAVSGMIPLLDTEIPVGYKIFLKLALLIPLVRDAGLYVRYEFGE
jgi:O-methyltransferase involved in polyketide biosynthesis